MQILDLLLQSYTSISLVGFLAVLVIYFISNFIFSSGQHAEEPPGPRPLPIIGNLLQIDLKRPYKTFEE
ncbi:Cytochrome P450 2M1, partial [Oryzias melastigma]